MNTATMLLPRTHAVILAGGRGERLHPLTLSRPKPLISFGGNFRIIDFTLSNCLKSGLKQAVLLTQYRHEDVHAYVRQTWFESWAKHGRCANVSLECLPPANGKRYRGTADAVFQNIPVLESGSPEFVVILAGDHIYDMDYRDLIQRHAETDADLTIAAIEHPLKEARHFGVIEVDRNLRVIGFEEKPIKPHPLPRRSTMALISMGVYIFKTDVLVQTLLEHCGARARYDFGHNIIPALIRSNRIFAYDFRDETQDTPRYWRDVGTVDNYYEASMDLVRPQAPFNPYIKENSYLRPCVHGNIGASVCGTAHVFAIRAVSRSSHRR